MWARHCKSDAVLNGGLRSSLTLGHADLLQLARIFRMTQPVGCERDCAALELWAGVVRVSIARFPSNARNARFDKRYGSCALQDSLPEWSKGVDSSSTSESCVGSNPTAVNQDLACMTENFSKSRQHPEVFPGSPPP